MNNELKNHGFSLTEVLIAVGILSVGMIFIAGVFPVAIRFTTIATERTVAAIAADEAFAKIRLYSVDVSLPQLQTNSLIDFNDVARVPVDANEFAYPSTDVSRKQYFWSALCRRVGAAPNRQVQVTVFVCRKAGTNLMYRKQSGGTVDRPMPIKVGVDKVVGKTNELRIRDSIEEIFINDGYTIVDNQTGRVYRVLERYADQPDTILLDRKWSGGPPRVVWVVPPATAGGRYPCIAIYQKVIRF